MFEKLLILKAGTGRYKKCEGYRKSERYMEQDGKSYGYAGAVFERLLILGAGTGRYKKFEGFGFKWSQIIGSQKGMEYRVVKAVGKCR